VLGIARLHNVPVPNRLTWAAALLLLLIPLSSCSGNDDDSGGSNESPTSSGPSVAVPAGVTLTDPGSSLHLGQPASVVYATGPQKVSVLTVTVRKIAAGSMKKDFKNFVLSPRELKSTPYYVSASVHNAGPGNLGGAKVPLYGFDSTNTYFPASPIVGDLNACQGGPLPKSFAPKATVQTCQVFIVGAGVTLDAVELRPNKSAEPIRWPLAERQKAN